MDIELKVGTCIYCGETSPPLTREHILPRGLGGNLAPTGHDAALVLQKASCEGCRLITSKIEDECLHRMMDYARARLGLKRKDRSKATMEMQFHRPDGTTERRGVDSSEVLGPVMIPSYYEAGALTNKPFTNSAPCDYKIIIVAPTSGSLRKEPADVSVQLSADSKKFAQMLAKIALGMAVARFGVTGFVPTVRNFILNNPDEAGHWVGGFAGTKRDERQASELHSILLQTKQVSAGTFMIAEIRLFAAYRGPTNYVVVGRPL